MMLQPAEKHLVDAEELEGSFGVHGTTSPLGNIFILPNNLVSSCAQQTHLSCPGNYLTDHKFIPKYFEI